MDYLKSFIKRVELHTGEKFDIDKKRHYILLSAKIKRAIEKQKLKLELITQVIQDDTVNELYNSSTHYTRKR